MRAGKAKTALGLFTDTQDAEAIHTWAVLPQAMYPLDLRSSTIAHTGGDIYGEVSLHRAGTLNYTAYIGAISDDKTDGIYYAVEDVGGEASNYKRGVGGADVRWTTPVTGLMIGGSFLDEHFTVDDVVHYPVTVTIHAKTDPDHVYAGYADYSSGKWHFNTELRRNALNVATVTFGMPGSLPQNSTGWFGSVSYRLAKRVELGTYNSRFYIGNSATPSNSASTHIFDQTATLRVDLKSFWSVKVEGHFMDGYGDIYSAHGFYSRSNRAGLKPTTDLLVIRTGFNF